VSYRQFINTDQLLPQSVLIKYQPKLIECDV